MALEMYLKITGIAGETGPGPAWAPAESIRILSYSWGQTGSITTGTGSITRPVPLDFSIVAAMSAASPIIFLNCTLGTHYQTAELFIGDSAQSFVRLRWVMEDTTIPVYKAGSSAGDGTVDAGLLSTETFALTFARLRMFYTPITPSGGAGTTITRGYNYKTNVPL